MSHHHILQGQIIEFGAHHIILDSETDTLFVDEEQLDADAFGGEQPSFGYDDDFGYDDFEGEDDDDDFEGEDEDDDDDDDDGDPDFGRGGRERRLERRASRKGRRASRAANRLSQYRAKHSSSRSGSAERRKGDRKVGWTRTVLAGQDSPAAAGTATITIRPQHDFEAEGLTLECSSGTFRVTRISMGSDTVWSSSTGVPHTQFTTTALLSKTVLKGNRIRGGLDIEIQGTNSAAADIDAIITGYKPADASCR